MNRKKKKTEREREAVAETDQYRRCFSVRVIPPFFLLFLFVTKQPVPSSTKKEEGYRLKREAQVPT